MSRKDKHHTSSALTENARKLYKCFRKELHEELLFYMGHSVSPVIVLNSNKNAPLE